jgi:hypothetical protein
MIEVAKNPDASCASNLAIWVILWQKTTDSRTDDSGSQHKEGLPYIGAIWLLVFTGERINNSHGHFVCSKGRSRNQWLEKGNYHYEHGEGWEIPLFLLIGAVCFQTLICR